MVMGHMVNIAAKHIMLRLSKFEKHLLIPFKDSRLPKLAKKDLPHSPNNLKESSNILTRGMSFLP